MNNTRLHIVILTVSLFFGSNFLFAQVTIGSVKEPAPGALLQLKEFDTDDACSNGQTTANKGIGMPRVALTSLTQYFATNAYFWTSSARSLTTVSQRNLDYQYTEVNKATGSPYILFSVRCVHD